MAEVSFLALGGDVRRSVRLSWWSHVGFDLVLKAVAAVALLPLSSWIVSRAVAASGRLAVSNTDIAQFLLSPLGMSAAIAWLVITLWIALAESVGQVWIAGGALVGKRIGAIEALWLLMKDAPRLTWLATLLTLVIMIGVTPLLVVALVSYEMLLSQFDLYYIVSKRPVQLYVALGIVAPVALITAFVFARYYVRWTLAIPAAVFGRLAARKALKESRTLVAKCWGLSLSVVVFWALVSVGIPAVISVLLRTTGEQAMLAMGERYALVVLVSALLVVSFGVALLLAAVIVTVGFNASAAGLYFRLRPSARDVMESYEPPSFGARKRRQQLIVMGVVVAVVVSIIGAISAIGELRTDRTIVVTAHRGSSGRAPENTLSAIRAAIEDGAGVAEIDVQETSDGAVVLIHDVDLRRLAGDARGVWELTLAEFMEVDAGGWFGPEFTGEPVPTLEDIIRVARDRIVLNIELKFNGHDVALPKRVVDILVGAQTGAGAVVSSLDYRALSEVRKLAPEIEVGFIAASTITDITVLDVDFLAVSTAMATRRFVRTAQRDGKQVHVWTVNDRAGMLRTIELGVDNIMTDDPALLREVLAERASLTDVEKLLLAFRNWLY
ncbi:MAG: glycerophosphodiester phosphodiesterase family protein [Gemmatimonadales bacterium]